MLKRRPQLSGFLVGFVMTALATYLCFGALDAKLFWDRIAYDLRVRHLNTIEPDERIVHIDIDDSAVDEIGRWPWRRERIADLLGVINELGADYVLVDLLISEQETPYYDDPLLYPDRDIDPDMVVENRDAGLDNAGGPPIVRADETLARVVGDGGNVIMAVELKARAPHAQRSIANRLAALLRETPARSKDDAAKALGIDDADAPAFETAWLRLRVIRALEKALTLNAAELAEQLNVERQQVALMLAGARREAAATWVKRRFDANPDATLGDVREAVFGDRTPRLSAEDQDIRKAYRAYLGLQDVAGQLIAADALNGDRMHTADAVVPVLHPIGASALDVAAVNFSADPDGIVRRIPPLIAYDGKVAMHMGVAGAAHILDLDFANAEMPHDRLLRIPRKQGEDSIDVPLDEDGNMIIPWTRTATRWREGEDFPHISAAALLEIVDNRAAQEENAKRLLYAWADVIAASKPATIATNTETGEKTTIYPDTLYRQRVHDLIASREKLAATTNESDAAALRQQIEDLQTMIEAQQKRMASSLEMNAAEIETMSEADIEAMREAVDRVHAGLEMLEQTRRLQEGTAKIAARVDTLIARLKPQIENKFVFVGFAATAQGDIVSTPIDPRTNGVICHSNVLNAFLQNRFITSAPTWMELPACLLAGAIVGLWTSIRSPRFALSATFLLIVAIFALGMFVLFQLYDVWYALIPFLVVLMLCWAAVTLFRQLTAERDKRMFRTQLSQYTSPAIAARIAESPEAAEAFKKVQTRDMTCYFSDLAGFTSISEREDAELVQHVLNVYLERMSETIWRHRGLINKFMGDGIMAFFNSSVDPLDDHARIACEMALDTLNELEALKQEMQNDPAAGIFQQLELRMGLAVGECKNGDMGSELKADYTVIGDVVNLSARLEPANKVFATQIMISGPLYDRVKDHFDVRYLAELQVKGKKKTVPVYELIGPHGSMTDEQRQYVERFEAGVELYKHRKWDECIVHFTRMLARRPDDMGAGRYIDACQEMKAFAPDDDWAGALELKEK